MVGGFGCDRIKVINFHQIFSCSCGTKKTKKTAPQCGTVFLMYLSLAVAVTLTASDGFLLELYELDVLGCTSCEA